MKKRELETLQKISQWVTLKWYTCSLYCGTLWLVWKMQHWGYGPITEGWEITLDRMFYFLLWTMAWGFIATLEISTLLMISLILYCYFFLKNHEHKISS
jgi:hypothetical protein